MKQPRGGSFSGSQGGGSAIYHSWSGEVVVLAIEGNRLSAYMNGREVGYLTFHVEREGPVTLFSFGYILVQPAYQGKKISSLLLYFFAMMALHKGAPLVRVVKPDPTLVGYWSHIGFDMQAAKRRFFASYTGGREPTREELASTVALEADGPAGKVMRLNLQIAASYWDLTADGPTGSHVSNWYEEQAARLKAFNMWEGHVKPLHDYSSSYIS